MYIAHFEKLTLVDFPGKIATTVFTPGCVLRCPYCHSPELVAPRESEKKFLKNNREKDFFAFLKTRKGKLDGVCITGGEPTLHTDLEKFIKRVKKMGFLVKLDTNGVFPNIVKKLAKTKLVDYWAMDIKHAPKKYPDATGVSVDIARIKESVKIIMESGQRYEFRTTVVPGIHTEKDFSEIASWIDGAEAYYLQAFRDVKVLDDRVLQKTRGKTVDLEKIKKNIGDQFGIMAIRQ